MKSTFIAGIALAAMLCSGCAKPSRPTPVEDKVADVVAPAEMAPLVRGVRTLGGKAIVPCPVAGDDSWTAIVYGDDGSFWYDYATTLRRRPAVLAAARNYGRGRVLAMGHGGYFAGANVQTADNALFGRNAMAWLDSKGTKTVCVRQPSGLEEFVDSLAKDGFQKRVVRRGAELRSSDLDGCGVLVFVAWEDPVSASEVEAIEAFVRNGGGLWLTGTAWAYVSHLKRNIETYAANVIGQKFGVRLENGVLHDPAHQVGTMEPHTFVRLCRTTGGDGKTEVDAPK